MPVRPIPKNYRNVTGRLASQKSDGCASFESTLERDFLTLLEFAPEVEDFEVQPVTIEWKDNAGKWRKYTPDVLVRYEKKTKTPPTLVEVKYRSDLKKDWAELKPRLKAGLKYAKEKGWRFKIMSEAEIRTPYQANAKFLLTFLNNGPEMDGYMELLDETLKTQTPTTADALTRSIFKDDWQRAKLIPTLWYLIARGEIGADLEKPLTMTSPIWYMP